ncbi:MAG: hypothetical protein HQL27_09965, partial [Candidatus Omnitrophica bacterium]|nr:hypothetical protein [Candidatus Omnitrophota bacterium]
NRYSYCFNNPVNFIDPSGNTPLSTPDNPLWYDKLSMSASDSIKGAKDYLFEEFSSTKIAAYSAAILSTGLDFFSGPLHLPAKLGHLGEGTGEFMARPTLDNAPKMLMDVSLTAGILSTVGTQLNTKYLKYTGPGSKPVSYDKMGNVNKGTWLTKKKYKSFTEAENKLQIPLKSRPIGNIEEVKVPWNQYIGGPKKVRGNDQWGEGGGIEYRVGGF